MILQKISDWNIRLVLQSLFQSESFFTRKEIKRHIELVAGNPRMTAFVKAFMATMTPYRLRKEGAENDVKQYRRYGHLPVERISCPSLILHGSHDADVKFYDGVYAYEHIPGARRFWIEEGSHLGFWISPNAEAAQQTARRFLDRCNGGVSKEETAEFAGAAR